MELILGLVFLLIIAFFANHSIKSKFISLKKNQARDRQPIPHDKIILAFEIQNFLVDYSARYIQGYRTLPIRSGLIGYLLSWLGYSPCFVQKYHPKVIREFFKELKKIKKAHLMIYTKLSQPVLKDIISHLNLQPYFSESVRLYDQPIPKSASVVDQETARVVIISASRQDQDHDIDGNHSLILKNPDENDLANLRTLLRNLIDKTESIDRLHQRMFQLAVNLGVPVLNDHN